MIKVVKNYNEANCITHNGTMHADEVFATAFLDLYKGNLKVYRVSDVSWDKVNADTLVYDIGRKEFGKEYLKKEGYENIDLLFEGIDKDLVEAIDADDNGFFPKIEANYKVKTLSNVIKLFNPGYESNETEDEQFVKAVEVAKQILYEEIIFINGKVHADLRVKEVLEDVNENDSYIILEEFLPYEDTLLGNEKYNNIKFVAYPSNRGGYAIKTVPKSINDKTGRLLFPKEWAGLTNDELEKVSGIKGLRFCHNSCFIVTCNSLETALEVLNKLCQ